MIPEIQQQCVYKQFKRFATRTYIYIFSEPQMEEKSTHAERTGFIVFYFYFSELQAVVNSTYVAITRFMIFYIYFLEPQPEANSTYVAITWFRLFYLYFSEPHTEVNSTYVAITGFIVFGFPIMTMTLFCILRIQLDKRKRYRELFLEDRIE